MMHYKNDDIVTKYYDKVYYTPNFSERKLLDLINTIINSAMQKGEIIPDQIEALINQSKENGAVLIDFCKRDLNTIRYIKKFEKILTQNLVKIKSDIYFPDLIVIAIIEASRQKLFDLIRKHKDVLSISLSIIETLGYLLGYSPLEKLKNTYSEIIDEYSLDPIDKEYLHFLFPHVKTTLEFQINYRSENLSAFRSSYYEHYEESEKKQRLCHFLLIYKFFTGGSVEENIDRITNQEFKSSLITLFNNPKLDYDSGVNKLEILFPQNDYNKDLRRMSLNWLRENIKSNSNEIVARNLLICLSIVAKNVLNDIPDSLALSEKKSAAFFVWEYLKRKDRDLQLPILLILNENNSDTFANTILFYSIHKDRDVIKLERDTVDKIAESYLLRIEKKLKSAKSIFDDTVFDDIYTSFWRWKQAIDYCKENNLEVTANTDPKNHIYTNTIDNPQNFEILFKYAFEDWGDDDISFKSNSYSLIFSEDDIVNLVDNYIMKSAYKDFNDRKVSVLKKWLSQKRGANEQDRH